MQAQPIAIEIHGHRGARAARPENTLSAFDYALELGVDGLELDVAITRDDQVVVVHDSHISPTICTHPTRTLTRRTLPVRSLTLEELGEFDCGTLVHPDFPHQQPVPGARMPTLAAVLDHVAQSPHPAARRVDLTVEIKLEPDRPDLTPSPERFAELVMAVILAHKMTARVMIQSFDYRPLMAVKRIAPQARTSMAIRGCLPDLVAAAHSIGAEIVSPHHEWITPDEVARLRDANLRVIVWTVNTPKLMATLVDMGVDGVITDDPATITAWLAQHGGRRAERK